MIESFAGTHFVVRFRIRVDEDDIVAAMEIPGMHEHRVQEILRVRVAVEELRQVERLREFVSARGDQVRLSERCKSTHRSLIFTFASCCGSY
jgi:hypothetical protein